MVTPIQTALPSTDPQLLPPWLSWLDAEAGIHKEHTGKAFKDTAELKDSLLLWVPSVGAADSNKNHQKDAVLGGPRGYHVPWQISHWTDIQRRWSHFTPDMQNHQQTLLVQEVLSIEFASIFLVKSMFLKSQWASQQSCSYAFWIKWEDLLWLQHVL